MQPRRLYNAKWTLAAPQAPTTHWALGTDPITWLVRVGSP